MLAVSRRRAADLSEDDILARRLALNLDLDRAAGQGAAAAGAAQDNEPADNAEA